MEKGGFVYLISNFNRTTIYIGVFNDIERRVLEHKIGIGSKFSSKYNLKYLMYFEEHSTINDAIEREKQLKNWHKEWKWNLVKEDNPNLLDLADDWYDKDMLNENMV
ncbi:MAG: GIY-YIG nuclease family protein [Vicingaceae bacterium]